MFGQTLADDLEVPVRDGLILERGFDSVPLRHGSDYSASAGIASPRLSPRSFTSAERAR